MRKRITYSCVCVCVCVVCAAVALAELKHIIALTKAYVTELTKPHVIALNKLPTSHAHTHAHTVQV